MPKLNDKNILQAVALKKELDDLRPFNAENEARIMQKFRLDWNFHSNNLEGNSLSYGETKALILFGITAAGKPLKDHFEISGHDDAVNWVLDVVKEKTPLTENFIRELHLLILKEPYQNKAITTDGKETSKTIQPGAYKTSPNHVRTVTGEIFYFATPEETPAKMHDLLAYYRAETEKKDFNPILLAADFHYRFVRIHPFDDGNGRLARILMNFILLRFGYPPVIVKTQDKENYFAALRQADAGLIKNFVNYIAGNLIHSLELMIRGVKGGDIEEADDVDKALKLLHKEIEDFIHGGRIRRSEDLIYTIFRETIVKLHHSLIEKFKPFEEFYYYYNYEMRLETFAKATVFNNLNEIETLDKDYFVKNSLIQKIKLDYTFREFIPQKNDVRDYNETIVFRFDNLDYEISVFSKTGIFPTTKRYDEQLTTDEIKKIEKYLIESFMDAIKEHLSVAKKNQK